MPEVTGPEEIDPLELLGQVAVTVTALIEVLAAKGLVTREEIEQKLADIASGTNGEPGGPSRIIRP
ncbi:MAG: hypothetical protein ABIK37_00240 [candidate division WOR-3 bacterium]